MLVAVERRAGLVGKLAVTMERGLRILGVKHLQQVCQRTFLGFGAGVHGSLAVFGHTTFVAIITVILVMTRLLSQTPGDLIYDRN